MRKMKRLVRTEHSDLLVLVRAKHNDLLISGLGNFGGVIVYVAVPSCF